MARSRWLVSALLLGASCVDTIEQHTSTVGEIVRDCLVPPPAGVAALDAPVSLEYPDASLWFWERVDFVGGGPLFGAAARVTSAAEACAAGPRLISDDRGAPASVLALTAAEQAGNGARTDGRRLALVPFGGVVVDGVGYLYYDQVLRGPGLFDEVPLGTGLCVLDQGARACERASGGAVLWPPDERVLNRGGLVVGTGAGRRALILGCRRVGAFEHPCTLAGVPTASLRDPAAYQVWNAFDGWVPRLTDATSMADEPGALTVAPFEGGYIATSLDIFASRIQVRRADQAMGPYGHRVEALAAVPPASPFVHGGREHAALRPEARSIAVTYQTDGAAAPGVHLVTFRFWGSFQ
jgi:hypothetical protein